MKKKPKRKVLPIIVIVVIFIIGVFIVVKQEFFKNKQAEIKVLTTIEKYNYTLDDNESEIYKKYFEDLEKCLKENDVNLNEYISLVAKLFAIDFYTLNNKITNKDIGGVQFLKEDLQENFALKASNTMYKYIESNIYGKRKQKLPEVKDVIVSNISETTIDKKIAYLVEVSIEYVKDMKYPTKILLTMVNENDKINIVVIKEVV